MAEEGFALPPATWTSCGEALLGLIFRQTTLAHTVPHRTPGRHDPVRSSNHVTVIVGGNASAVTRKRVLVNCLVPIFVSSTGFLAATRSREQKGDHRGVANEWKVPRTL
jgi:hypothetical protein